MESQQPDNEQFNPADLYNIELDTYKGPLDLLLYLIRRAEVDIYDIPIAEITTQYLSYIDLMRKVNITIAGEFVLMAATLMEIKSKMLLPKSTLDDLEGEEEEDPRSELVRQLLEYKRFKDAALMLGEAEEQQARKFPRPPLDKDLVGLNEIGEDDDPFEDVELWDLLTAFSKILKETRLNEPRTIIETDKPLRFYMQVVLAAAREQQKVRFTQLFVDAKDKSTIIGTFLAILELVRLRRLKIEQVQTFGEIYLAIGEDDEEDEDLPDDEELGYGSAEDEAGDGGDSEDSPQEKVPEENEGDTQGQEKT